MAETGSETVINDLASTIGETCEANGFWEQPQPELGQLNTKLLLIVSEVIEAMNVLREGRGTYHGPDIIHQVLSFRQAEHFFEELADVIIRVLDVSDWLTERFEEAGHYGWRIGEVLHHKVEHNKTRPYRHNKAF